MSASTTPSSTPSRTSPPRTSCTRNEPSRQPTRNDRRSRHLSINYLILIDQIAILELLYGRILIPHAVHDEMLSSKAPPTVRGWAKNPPNWLEILSPSAHLHPLIARLDRGETEAIALAEELNADWLVIDDAAGRDEATRRGLPTIGTLGILRDAHQAGLLDFPTAVNRLSASGFRANQSLIQLLMDSI